MFLGIAVVIWAVLRINAQTKVITDQGKTIVALQQGQTEAQKTGRTTQVQVQQLVEQIASFTSPTSTVTMDQQQKVQGYITALLQGQQTQNADVLRKLGEMAVALGAPKATIDRILAEPSPTIIIPLPKSAAASGNPAGASPSPASTPGIGVGLSSAPIPIPIPTPSGTSCPRIRIGLGGLVGICIPP
jgi:hypothetical protein